MPACRTPLASAGSRSRSRAPGRSGWSRSRAARRSRAPGSWSRRCARTRSATASTPRSWPRACSRSTTRAHARAPLADGKDFVPTNRWVVFGHHFAAIAGPGPLVGPILAAQFGYLPGTLYILIGVVLGGAVQDFTILVGSLRRNGKSLGQMVREEIGPIGGAAALVGVLAIMIILIGVLGLVVVNAHVRQPVGDVRPSGRRFRSRCSWACTWCASAPGQVLEAQPDRRRRWCCSRWSAGAGSTSSETLRAWFDLDKRALALAIIGYGFVGERAAGVAAARAARLPVHVHEDRHGRAARGGAALGAPGRAAAGAHEVHRRHRARCSRARCFRSASSRSPAARCRASTR